MSALVSCANAMDRPIKLLADASITASISSLLSVGSLIVAVTLFYAKVNGQNDQIEELKMLIKTQNVVIYNQQGQIGLLNTRGEKTITTLEMFQKQYERDMTRYIRDPR